MNQAVEAARGLRPGATGGFESATRRAMRALESDPEVHKAVAAALRAGFPKVLSQGHDFLQLVKLVRGHAETLLRSKRPDLALVEAAESLPTEGSIYFATELMLVKMDSLLFLEEPNRAFGNVKKFQIYPFIDKYARIYSWQSRQKKVDIVLAGSCFSSCRYNSAAIGAVIQGLLDNMVKYSSARSPASISFSESSDAVQISFDSLGPRIEDDERQKIFLPGFRAQAAQNASSGGLGIGLATARQISDALGLQLEVRQSAVAHPNFPSRFETTFSFIVDRVE